MCDLLSDKLTLKGQYFMQRYNNLIELRENANSLYEELKVLQIFVDETVENIHQTIIEKIYCITDIIDSCLILHSKLQYHVLKLSDVQNKKRKIINFDEIKI